MPILILNLVITRGDAQGQVVESVPADVSVSLSNLIGQTQTVEMRAIDANEGVSYIGFFDTANQQIFRFAIRAAPAGSDKFLTMGFEDQYRQSP